MVNTAYAMNAYTESKVLYSQNPMELVIMLYDGAIEFLEKAAKAIVMKEVPIKIKYIDKTMNIIQELLNSLNMEIGEDIAVNLEELYGYMMRELFFANVKNDEQKISQVIDLLKELRSAWIEIKDKV
jgi:flagellar secretion chaperone FliS